MIVAGSKSDNSLCMQLKYLRVRYNVNGRGIISSVR
jgi:hypothetical protein